MSSSGFTYFIVCSFQHLCFKLCVFIFSFKHLAIQGQRVTTSNHVADNGVVHIINGVMMPPNGTFVDIISADPEFSTLKAAVETAGIAEALNGN